MGQRTTYYQSTDGRSLKELLLEEYKVFRIWILTKQEESVREFKEPLISDHIEHFLDRNQSLRDPELVPQRILDALVFEYLCSYCDYGEGRNRFDIVGPMMSTWRYKQLTMKIATIGDGELQRLWNVLVKGRSIFNGRPFLSMDDEGEVIGFWTKDEQKLLRSKLIQLYPNVGKETGKESSMLFRYWRRFRIMMLS